MKYIIQLQKCYSVTCLLFHFVTLVQYIDRKLLLTNEFTKRLDGAINCNCMRDAEESVKKSRILEGGENRSSKTAAGGSKTKHCKGRAKTFKNMATTYRPGHGQFRPLSGVYLSSPCQPCPPRSFNCFSFSCVTTVHCQSINGSTPTCTRSEKCTRIQPGHWSDYKTLNYIYIVLFLFFFLWFSVSIHMFRAVLSYIF